MLSLVHVLEWRAAVNPEAIVLTDQQGAELSYAALAEAAERTAAGFAAAGIAPGDVVPIIARNQAGWVTAMLGLIRAGAFPAAPDAVPGVSAPVTVPGMGEWTSAVGSMNHVAFNVPEERFLEYRSKLKSKGVRVSPIIDHDDSEFGVARELHPGVFVRSFYFQDPDGILLEFACWRRVMGQPGDVRHEPKTAADRTGVRV